MAYYYVRTHADGTGTATGDGGRNATLQTGDWDTTFSATTQYWAKVADALAATTPPAAGDFIIISDIHSETTAVGIFMPGASGLTADCVTYMSVDDVEIETPKTATTVQISTTANSDIDIGGVNHRTAFHGLYLQASEDISNSGNNSSLRATNCTFEVIVSGDRCVNQDAGDGSYSEFINCTLNADGSVTTVPIYVATGCTLLMTGGSVTSDQATVNGIVYGGALNGGARVELTGVDLSICNAAGDYLVFGVGSSTNDDTMLIKFTRCKLGASLAGFVEEALYGSNKRVEVYNCAAVSAEADYQFYIQSDQHTAEDYTTTYRNESTAFTDSGTKVSIEVKTAAHCSRGNWFYFDLPARYAELSNASTDTLRVFLNSDTALTDNDVWCELVYPDGTNKHVANSLSSRDADILGTGTTLTTDSASTWTNGKTNKYQIDLDTSSDVGADCYPIIRVYVAKASLTVYFDVVVDVVA